MKRDSAVKGIVLYYLNAVIFVIASYAFLFLIYGQTRVSFFEWALIIFVAFTIGCIPGFIRLFRGGGAD